MSYMPFIVYATDTPVFPSGEIWPYNCCALRDRARYGYPTQGRSEISGSLIILSGGWLSQIDATEGKSYEQIKMYLAGCLGMQNRLGDLFVEIAVVEMLDPDARVTMVLYVSRDEAFDHLDTVRDAGFNVIVTGDVNPITASNYAVCLGTAKMLREYEWLSQVWPYEPYFFLSNHGPQSEIEKAITYAAVSGTDPEVAAVNLLKQVEQVPDSAESILGQHYVRIGFTDPEMKSLLIMQSDPDLSNIERLYHKIAQEIGIGLYDAGSLRVPDMEDRYLTEFSLWDRETPVPKHWKKVV